jgi:hypothetical protein
MISTEIDHEIVKVTDIVEKMADPDIFAWLGREEPPTQIEIHLAATIVADRLCGAVAKSYYSQCSGTTATERYSVMA